jgi:hypothetical protein
LVREVRRAVVEGIATAVPLELLEMEEEASNAKLRPAKRLRISGAGGKRGGGGR